MSEDFDLDKAFEEETRPKQEIVVDGGLAQGEKYREQCSRPEKSLSWKHLGGWILGVFLTGLLLGLFLKGVI